MKSFVASILVFSALLGVIFLNYCYVLRVCEEFEKKVDALPKCSEATEAVDELVGFWDGESRKLKFSLPLREIEKMEECLAELRYAASFEDARVFEQSRSRVKAIIKEIYDGEVPRFENWM